MFQDYNQKAVNYVKNMIREHIDEIILLISILRSSKQDLKQIIHLYKIEKVIILLKTKNKI